MPVKTWTKVKSAATGIPRGARGWTTTERLASRRDLWKRRLEESPAERSLQRQPRRIFRIRPRGFDVGEPRAKCHPRAETHSVRGCARWRRRTPACFIEGSTIM
jgi:hypothetical protein